MSLPPRSAPPAFERWLWIELIGFDNTQPDLGVGALLDNAGFVPDVVSLLLYNADFIHTHRGLETEHALPPDCCSYAGHPRNEERERQVWTTHQLRALVRELQRRGVQVCPAVFDLFETKEWIGRHPEVLHVHRKHGRLFSVCPWKRLADGSYYQDFFVGQLRRVMADYGFDGYHGADGYAHPRIPIHHGDFSDDMVGQFTRATGAALPQTLSGSCDDDPGRLYARGLWIWEELRREWIAFYASRIEGFWRQVAAALHADGKRVVLNSAWTRDPFEALYRYGVDYRRLERAGVDGFVVEAAAAASESEREASSARVLYEFAAMLLLNKACTPRLPMRILHGVKDTREQWNVLRHAPTSLEREVCTLGSLWLSDGAGALRRCADGLVVCLADGIQSGEWRWLRGVWDRAFSAAPRRVLGATLVWSDSALDRSVEDYIATRRWSQHRLLHRLMARSAPICSAIRLEDLGGAEGPLLVLHPHLFPEPGLKRLLAYRAGPLLMIGAMPDGLPSADLEVTAGPGAADLSCRVYGMMPLPVPEVVSPPVDGAANDVLEDEEPATFLEDLPYRPVPESFLDACVALIQRCTGALRATGGAGSVIATEELPGRLRILIGNDSHGYTTRTVDVGRPVHSVRSVTPYPPLPIVPDGTRFRVRVPPRGVVLVDAEVASQAGGSGGRDAREC